MRADLTACTVDFLSIWTSAGTVRVSWNFKEAVRKQARVWGWGKAAAPCGTVLRRRSTYGFGTWNAFVRAVRLPTSRFRDRMCLTRDGGATTRLSRQAIRPRPVRNCSFLLATWSKLWFPLGQFTHLHAVAVLAESFCLV